MMESIETKASSSSTNSLVVTPEDASNRMQTILNNLQDLNPNRMEDSINNPNLQKEILNLIEKCYFNHEDKEEEINDEENDETKESSSFKVDDIIEYELKKYTNNINKSDIKTHISKLQLQLQVVSRKVSDSILANGNKCSIQLTNVTYLKEVLECSLNYCMNARYLLNKTQNKFTVSSLNLIKNELRKKNLINLLKSMNKIKLLQKTNIELKEMIDKEDYPKAIELCLQCQKASSTYEHYRCISDLKSKMQDRLDQIELNLDVAISKICFNYNKDVYMKIINAYELLGKSQTFVDQLNMHFVSAITNCSVKTVFDLISDTNKMYQYDELRRKEYKDLCELLQQNDYEVCLQTLCLNLWLIMKNFYQAFMLHKQYLEEINNNETKNDFEIRYIKHKFEHCKIRIWHEIQNKVNICFRSMRMDDYKFDDFMYLLEIMNRFMEIGYEFCDGNADCQIMLNATKDQTLEYIKSYHILRLEELKMFLENEQWILCPIKSNFSIMNLHEFKFIRNYKNNINTPISNNIKQLIRSKIDTPLPPPRPPPPQVVNNRDETTKSVNGTETDVPLSAPPPPLSNATTNLIVNKYIVDLFSNENPFNLKQQQQQKHALKQQNSFENDKNHDSDESDDDQLAGESLDDIKKASINGISIPIVTNTTLSVLRLFGKCIHMLKTIDLISFDLIVYMSQLFYFYFYYIYLNFARREIEINKNIVSETIHNLIKTIRSDLFGQNKYINEPEISAALLKQIKTRDDYIDGLKERFIAAESVVFLANQFEQLFPYINEYTINSSQVNNRTSAYLEQLKMVLSKIYEIRSPIYMHMARYSIDYPSIIESITRVNWDINEIMSEHNYYVNMLCDQMKQVISDLSYVKEHHLIPINKVMFNAFVEQTLRICMKVIVDAYSQAKKCTNEGRALMQLDFQHLLIKLEKLCDIKPLPDKEYVELYIKAYYLPETQIEKWIKEHTEYNPKHIISLLNCMQQLTRKTRSNLINSFQESTFNNVIQAVASTSTLSQTTTTTLPPPTATTTAPASTTTSQQ